jgi:hypothetical protein
VVDSPAPSAAAIHLQIAEAFALDDRGAELLRAALYTEDALEPEKTCFDQDIRA